MVNLLQLKVFIWVVKNAPAGKIAEVLVEWSKNAFDKEWQDGLETIKIKLASITVELEKITRGEK